MKYLKNNFFLFPIVCIFDFCKNISPRLYILHLVDKSVKCMIVFQQLNFDPVQKYWKHDVTFTF